jgi:hypothetical protein
MPPAAAGHDAFGRVAPERRSVANPIADLDLGDAGTDGDDLARAFVTGDER